jgi:hypothetical protein
MGSGLPNVKQCFIDECTDSSVRYRWYCQVVSGLEDLYWKIFAFLSDTDDCGIPQILIEMRI